ncbi:MAG: hypothetical protein JWR38_3162 [Mucilaginibacter sp.]|nr:hypothetical protein [Mucilaginibacter sp.]
MFLRYKLFISACIIGLSFAARAQTTVLDSLRSVIDNPTLNEKEKPALLNQLAQANRINKNYDTAIANAKQSIALALKHKNFTEATKAYALIVNIKAFTQQFTTLKQTCDTALTMAQQAHDPIAMAYAYYARVWFYKTLGDAENVVKYGQLGLKELGKKTDPYLASKIYYQLYVINSDWNNEAKVNFYARKATENALQAKDYNMLSNCYTALSVAHEYNYNKSKSKAELDSLFFYLNQSQMLYRQYPGQVSVNTYAIACTNIADAYLKYSAETDKNARNQAIRYAGIALAVLKNSGNSQEIVASCLGLLSEYARRDGNILQQENYLQEAYRIMKTQQPPYYYTMINVVQALSDFYEKKGDYQQALSFQKKVTEYNNKNFNQQQALNTQKLEIQYETEKKNSEMQVLKEQEKSRRMQNYLYGYIALASVLGLLFMFRSYHYKLRYSMQREKQLQLENQESELQVKLEKEEQARLRAEQQLLETQQQQLKLEVMANTLQLEHKNQMLHNIKDKLTEGDPVNMQRILKEEMMLDNDFEHATLQIQRVHPNFFHLLNDKTKRKLTLLDLKLCAYLYLKMDTRQISQLMHIEAKSVRMSRYRIKQKLGLEKEEDLNIFLQKLGN